MTTSTTGDSNCTNPLGLALTDQLGQAPERSTMRLSLADLGVLADTAERNGTMRAFPAVALQWAAGAQAEIERLRRAWEDTRTQRDQLLAHLTRGEPLPAWAVEWIRVYKA